MKQFAVTILILVSLALVGCGSNSSNPANINGTWNATLLDSGNNPSFTFGTSLRVNGDGSVTITNLSLNSNMACFGNAGTATGSFTLSGNFSGQVHGSFGMTVPSNPSGNTLALNGTAAGNTISGTWTLTGPGCTGSGTFTMNKM
jgi:hypothetical protein